MADSVSTFTPGEEDAVERVYFRADGIRQQMRVYGCDAWAVMKVNPTAFMRLFEDALAALEAYEAHADLRDPATGKEWVA